MLKKLFSIIILTTVFFLGCKKDAPAYPAPVVVQQIDTTKPFVLQDIIFPNPCHGTFTIKTNTNDSQNVKIYSVVGQQILNLTINGTTAIVDNSLTNGVYIILISGKHGTIHRKIIVN
jgi:hypothetical protein